MAGFFGLFNYEKEGPGIAKNAPKKKGIIIFFETFFRNFWKFITDNVVYCLMSVLIIPHGLAAAGITNITRNTARDKHSFGLSDFFDTIKKNWKQALPAGIINFFIYVILLFDLYFFYNSKGVISSVGTGITLCMMFILTIMTYYIWTLIITFKFSLKQIYRNSFKFVFINMKMNLLCFFAIAIVYLVNIAILYLLLQYAYVVITFELLVYMLIFPAYRYLLVQYCTFPAIKKFIIDPYYKDHPDEDIDKRGNLGIEVEQEEKAKDEQDEDSDSENVFED